MLGKVLGVEGSTATAWAERMESGQRAVWPFPVLPGDSGVLFPVHIVPETEPVRAS